MARLYQIVHAMPRVLPTLLAMLALPTVARASTVLHTLDAQAYRDEAALYPSVGKVSGSGMSGSGVLISDRWVLTAGHVADFKTGGLYNIGGVNYTIQSVVAHPSHPVFSTTYDVGLLYLSSAVTGIDPAVMYRFPGTTALLGREATWVGNGLTGTGLDDNRGVNEMRAFTNIIDGVTPYAGLPGPSFYSDFDNPDGTSNSLSSLGSSPDATRLEGNVTPGDSGGGVFTMVGGTPYLIGIGSYTSGFAPGMNSKYGSLSGAADLYHFHSWIEETTGIQAIPEPSAVALLLPAFAFAIRRRR